MAPKYLDIKTSRVNAVTDELLENGNARVTAVEVAAAMLPELILAIASVMEQRSSLRFFDSQDDVACLGPCFSED